MRLPHLALWAALLLGAMPLAAQPLPAGLTLQTINPAPNNLPGIVGVRNAGDGSDRLFAIVRTGQIRIFDADRALLATPFLNFSANPPPLGFTLVSATGGDERGLLGLAFHPLYASNGRFYVYYLDGNSDTVVVEYTRSASDPNVADVSTARVILRVYDPFTNHNGGDIHFGADGYLYIGIGDGGSGDDPCNSGQSLSIATLNGGGACSIAANDPFRATPVTGIPLGNLNSRALLGKMLRIDVDSTHTPAGADLCGADPATRRYGIPSDNPFAGDAGGNADACDEVYHYGLRNPYRFSFDRDTHELFIGDVGQNRFEEIDFTGAAGGLNFGWNICEGFHVRGSTGTLCTLAGRTDPILELGRSLAVAITGGYRYRGPYAAIDGVYFYADSGTETVFYARQNGGAWTGATWLQNQGTVVGFGEDEQGGLYLVTLQGAIKRFALPQGDLRVTKTASFTTDAGATGVADTGDVISYSVTVQNTGTLAVTSLVVQDQFGGDAPTTLACTPSATLAAGATATCAAYTHAVTQDDVDAGAALVNEATATAQDTAVGEVTDSATATVPIAATVASMNVSVIVDLDDTDGSGAASAGETIAYAYRLENTGNVRLHDLTFTSTRSGTTTCAPAVSLDPGFIADCGDGEYAVTAADVLAGVDIVNVATGAALAPDDSAVTDAGQGVQAVDAPAAVALALTVVATLSNDVDGDNLADVGDSVSHTYTVENSGNVEVTSVFVASSLHGAVACVPDALAPDDVATCASAHVVTVGDIGTGDVVDTAFARATAGGDMVDSPPQETSVAADRGAAIFADGFEGP